MKMQASPLARTERQLIVEEGGTEPLGKQRLDPVLKLARKPLARNHDGYPNRTGAGMEPYPHPLTRAERAHGRDLGADLLRSELEQLRLGHGLEDRPDLAGIVRIGQRWFGGQDAVELLTEQRDVGGGLGESLAREEAVDSVPAAAETGLDTPDDDHVHAREPVNGGLDRRAGNRERRVSLRSVRDFLEIARSDLSGAHRPTEDPERRALHESPVRCFVSDRQLDPRVPEEHEVTVA